MPHAHFFAWSLGKEELCHPASPTQPNCPHLPSSAVVTVASTSPLCPEADPPHFFLQTVGFFLPSPHCTETALWQFFWGSPSLSPTPAPIWFSTLVLFGTYLWCCFLSVKHLFQFRTTCLSLLCHSRKWDMGRQRRPEPPSTSSANKRAVKTL